MTDPRDTAPQPPPVPTESEFTPKPGWLKRVFEQNSDLISRLPIEMRRAGGFEDIPDPREARIAALEAQLAEAQERLAMVMAKVDGMSQYPDPEYVLEVCRELQAATADAVAQHTAEVERRGAEKALDKLLSTLSPDGLPWTPKYPYELHHAVENLKRAVELEGA